MAKIKTCICFLLLFVSILSVFGANAICGGITENCDCDTYTCSYMDETKYPYYTYGHFCLIPHDKLHAPQIKIPDGNRKPNNFPIELFSSRFKGCRLSIGYPQNTISANFDNSKVVKFTKECGEVDYFSTKMDITYEAYDKGNPIPQTHEKLERKISNSGYSLLGKIREFKTGVNSVNKYIYYKRDIYTLRVKEAVITDDKCPTKHKIEDRPISVATKLLLELKLNADDRIVYDDKETKKIEVNADQDESNGGTTYAD